MFRVDPDCVRAITEGRETSRGRARILLAPSIEPPKIAVIWSDRGGRRRHLDPIFGNDLFLVPLATAQEKITEAGLVACIDPQAAAPACATADGHHSFAFYQYFGIEVAVISPGIGSADA